MVKSLSSVFGSSSTAVIGASVAAVVVVAGAVGFMALREEEGAAAPDVPALAEEAAAPEAGTVDPVAPVAPVAEPEAQSAPEAPRFDVVRVEDDGRAVIAGQAPPNAEVTLRLGDQALAAAQADVGGNFVAMLTLEPSDAPRMLGLEAMTPDGETLTGAETVIIAPFALASDDVAEPEQVAEAADPGAGTAPAGAETQADTNGAAATGEGEAPLIASGDNGAEPAAEPASEDVAGPQDTQPAEPEAPQIAETDTAPEAPEGAPAVLLADGEGVQVLQSGPNAPDVQTEIALDAITYNTEGDVTLSGRGPVEAGVRVTLDNQPIQLGEVGPGGQWRLDLPDVDPGTYTLRIEQIAEDGGVTSEVELPFLREDPERIRDNPMLVAEGASVITVQRGFTLWGIAEANFGDGFLFVQVFDANRDEIRDPDLIFPGQIFDLPDLPRTAPVH